MYWSTRDLAPVLGYARWDRFQQLLRSAQRVCALTGAPAREFQVLRVPRPQGGGHRDVWLTRRALLLLVQQADPHNVVTAQMQHYIAVQVHRAEQMRPRRPAPAPAPFDPTAMFAQMLAEGRIAREGITNPAAQAAVHAAGAADLAAHFPPRSGAAEVPPVLPPAGDNAPLPAGTGPAVGAGLNEPAP